MMSDEAIIIKWKAPSNIALIKYWGKKGHQLPENCSLSFSLEKSATVTSLTFQKKYHPDNRIISEYYFHGQRNPSFEKNIALFLNDLIPFMPFLADYMLVFRSENNFPHSTGIASSASSMSALALCLVSMEEIIRQKKLDRDDFFRRASCIARLGSGSASRSVYGGFVSWGESEFVAASSDEYATPFLLSRESRLRQIYDIILIVSSNEKKVTSTSGHSLMKQHPFREGRIDQANNNMHQITLAIRNNDYHALAAIVENEALSLHALLMTSSPDGLLLKPNTLSIIEAIRSFRNQSGLDLFFTIDAGPNVHLIYFEDQRHLVLPFVEEELSLFCENGQWIDDKIGAGPQMLTPEIKF
jgi:diphosphomevalonate decarboxylase